MLLGLIVNYYQLWKAEEEIQKTFSVCPLCGSNRMEATFGLGMEDEITCNACGAEWKLFIDPLGKLSWAKLITPGKVGGAELAGEKKPPDFWISLSKQRHPNLWHTVPKTSNYQTHPSGESKTGEVVAKEENSRRADTSKMSIQEVKMALKELNELYEKGLITKEDYEQKRKELFSRL